MGELGFLWLAKWVQLYPNFESPLTPLSFCWRRNRNPLDQKIDQGVSDEDVCEKRNPQASEKAAEIVGSNHQYVSDAKKIAERSPELAEKVRAGEVSIAQAKRRK